MGREVRRVPANWVHPKIKTFDYFKGCYVEHYQPMYDEPFLPAMHKWIAKLEAWERGERPDYCTKEHRNMPYWEWDGGPPTPLFYRPVWKDEERTHLMMYEDTSEGTPISPAFKTPEELARWLVDNNASFFGRETGSYEGWLRIAKGGFAPSMVVVDGVVSYGVDSIKP